MTKSELIRTLCRRHNNLPSKEAEIIVNIIFNSMFEALRKGEHIEIRGFSTFTVKNYKSYTGRNPKTGEPIKVNKKKLPYFKPGKEMKERVDNVIIS